MLMSAWVALGRLRRRIGKPPLTHTVEVRHDWVRRHAPGRSFLDVGGMYAIKGEIAFLAEEAGASRVTALDAGDAPLVFEPERRRRGSSVRYVQGDLEDPEAAARVGVHDVVFCTGVVYHSPNPVRQLLNLRAMCGDLLYFGTHAVPEVPGFPGACLYYPAFGEAERRALSKAYWRPEEHWGIGTPFNERAGLGYGNFWWGLTPSAVRAMLHTAGFDVLEERRVHETPFLLELVARASDRPPLLPPVSYFRARGEHWEADEVPFDWVDDSWREARDHGELPG
jgi:hypothetical protein